MTDRQQNACFWMAFAVVATLSFLYVGFAQWSALVPGETNNEPEVMETVKE